MKKEKWYSKLFGVEPSHEELKFKSQRLEVYELFKKNKFKTEEEKQTKKQSQ